MVELKGGESLEEFFQRFIETLKPVDMFLLFISKDNNYIDLFLSKDIKAYLPPKEFENVLKNIK